MAQNIVGHPLIYTENDLSVDIFTTLVFYFVFCITVNHTDVNMFLNNPVNDV